MKNILYTRRKYEKINPGSFDVKATILIYSTITNDLGEEESIFTEGEEIFCLYDTLNSAIETQDRTDFNEFMFEKGVLITWLNDNLLDTKNRVRIDGNDYDIIDGTKAFSRNRFVRCLLTLVK
jgi:hypothetical protein